MPFDRVEGRQMLRRLRPAETFSARDVQDLPAEPAVSQQGGNVGMPAKTPVAILLPKEDRRRGLNLAIGGIGIIVKVPIARIERDPPAIGVDLQRQKANLQSRGYAASTT